VANTIKLSGDAALCQITVSTVVNIMGLTIAVPKCRKWDKDAVNFTVCEDLVLPSDVLKASSWLF